MTERTSPGQRAHARLYLETALDMLRVSMACGYPCVDPLGIVALGPSPAAGVSYREARDEVLKRVSDEGLIKIFGLTRAQVTAIQDACMEVPKHFLCTMTETLNNGSVLLINGVEFDCSLVE